MEGRTLLRPYWIFMNAFMLLLVLIRIKYFNRVKKYAFRNSLNIFLSTMRKNLSIRALKVRRLWAYFRVTISLLTRSKLTPEIFSTAERWHIAEMHILQVQEIVRAERENLFSEAITSALKFSSKHTDAFLENKWFESRTVYIIKHSQIIYVDI